MMMETIKNVHFVGIGGIGMSGIAEILLSQGFHITGSDLNKSEVTERLESLGIKIYEGHSSANLKEADVVVFCKRNVWKGDRDQAKAFLLSVYRAFC